MEEDLSAEALEAHLFERDCGGTGTPKRRSADAAYRRARYCARLSRFFEFPPGSSMETSKLKPECLQVSRLSALAGRRDVAPPHLLDESTVEKELDHTPAEALGHLMQVAEWAGRRSAAPPRLCMKLPSLSKPPSSTMACQWEFQRKNSPKD